MCDSTCAAFIANVVPTPSRACLLIPISLCCPYLRQTLAAPHLHGSQGLWASGVGVPPLLWGFPPGTPHFAQRTPRDTCIFPMSPR